MKYLIILLLAIGCQQAAKHCKYQYTDDGYYLKCLKGDSVIICERNGTNLHCEIKK